MYTIEERLKIYKKMLKIYKLSKFLRLRFFLNTDKGFYWHLTSFWILIVLKEDFPELYEQKPHITYKSTSYWWKPGRLNPRIKALEAAIKLTEERISK